MRHVDRKPVVVRTQLVEFASRERRRRCLGSTMVFETRHDVNRMKVRTLGLCAPATRFLFGGSEGLRTQEIDEPRGGYIGRA